MPVAENRLDRNFIPTAPNPVGMSDIPSLWTGEGGLSLAIVRDLFNREGVGWSLKPRRTTDLVTDALTPAWFRKQPVQGRIPHCDRGSQYARHAFQGSGGCAGGHTESCCVQFLHVAQSQILWSLPFLDFF